MPVPSLRDALASLALAACAALAVPVSSFAAVHEDGTGAANWRVSDANPAGASVVNVNDDLLGEVIETRGAGRANSYLLGGYRASAGGWNETDAHHIGFRLRTDEAFSLYVRVDTRDGGRWLHYNHSNSDALANARGNQIHHGLGGRTRDGRWRQIGRDLAADLAAGQPGNELLAVQGILVRGNVRLDDIALGDERLPERVLPILSPEVDFDAEDGDTSMWSLFDASPAGATIEAIGDEARLGRVYALVGAGRSNGYRLGGLDATDGWNNTEARVLSWAMRTAEAYSLSVRVSTSGGTRQINYTHSNSGPVLGTNGRDIGIGLGSGSRDGRWQQHSRDLAADIASVEPGNTLEAVHGVLVRGSLRLDDIRLADSLAPRAIIAGEAARSIASGEAVTLDGSSSVDPDGRIVAWRWRDARGAELGDDAVLALDALAPGSARYVLSVTDDAGLMASASVAIEVLDTTIPTVYEDAENGDTDGWRIYDRTPDGASIANVADAAGGDGGASSGRVIELAGSGLSNGFMLGYWDARSNGWNNTLQRHVTWRMRADSPVYVYVRLQTRDGGRNLLYLPSTRRPSVNGSGTTIHHGLGPDAIDGEWHTWTRDLAADLAAVQPDNALIAVHGFLVRGSGRFDDIALIAPPPPTSADTEAPDVVLAASPTSGEAPLAVTLDPSGSGDDTAVTSVRWDFGDGSAPLEGGSLAAVTHVYAAGNHTATLTLGDAAGNVASASVDIVVTPPLPPPPVNAAPTAAFVAVAGEDAASLTLDFDASASGDDAAVVAWTWRFGDEAAGTTAPSASGERVEHTYTDAGTYTVTLVVTDAEGLEDTTTRDIEVTAPDTGGEPPTAIARSDLSGGPAPLTVTFDGSASTVSDGAGPLRHVWAFSDGGAALEGAVVTRTFDTPGEIVATLTVTDARDRRASDLLGVSVSSPEPGPGSTVTEAEAARLLAQTTFGPDEASIARVRALGIEGWIDEQLGLRGPPHLDYVRANSNGSSREARHDIWWRDAIEGEDQLRQRVAFALSQIFVVADTGYTLANAQYGVTRYYDLLRDGAFGRYRDLLEQVTLHPVMGIYLSMLQNDKGDPSGNTRADENFAREVLQLFSIGPHLLNADGTTRMSGSEPVPAYTQRDIENYARVFTGWNFAGASRWDFPVLRTDADKVRPMEPNEAHHDTGVKTLLGGVRTTAGATARQDLELALDSIADHANVGPFIVSQLIKRLVTSNPTPAYVRRVAAVFDDDGRGRRGELGAVIKAILLDPEAREGHRTVADFGKLREPVLRISHLWRAFGATPGASSVNGNYNTRSPHAKDLDTLIGQAVLKSPSVFNFYRPDHAPVGELRSAGRVAPEAELYTERHVLAATTRMNWHVQYHHDLGDANSRKSTFIDLALERAVLAADGVDALLDRLDLLLLSGDMSQGLRGVLRDHVNGFAASEQGRSQAVRDVISLIVASPEYLVQM